jgi:D-alanyl-lipoteichoic acid acyltransferase DltB (MBOAT superfamily)
MVFNSLQFALFFVIVTTLYFVLPYRARGPMLLIASSYFYMAFVPRYILILFFTIAIDYAAGLLIERATGRTRRLLLVASLAANLGVLAFFKYFNFLNDTIRAVAAAADVSYSVSPLTILLPIGLSFHTFQSMSYTVEVYRGHQRAERNLATFALYVMFYPQLVAGPIERPQNLLHQLKERHDFDYELARSGLQLMAWGLFKKIAVADRVAPAVNAVYADPSLYSGWSLLMATYLFAVQIYCDFSGYSDIAIGAAQVRGFRLMRNFNHPYFSRTISEFWRRWHISLSTWFRDYVYLPLGGNQAGPGRRAWNLMAVFLLSGLWHGASWTFVVWGALNGAYVVASHASEKFRARIVALSGLDRVPRVHAVIAGLVTFHLVVAAWVFFRAESIADAIFALWAIATHRPGLELSLDSIGGATRVAMSVAALMAVEILQSRINLRGLISSQPVAIRWPAYIVLVVSFLLLGNFGSDQRFIYFQF